MELMIGRLLADEEVARAMKRQAALLFYGLGRHEPHIGSRNSFANRFRIGGIVLLSFEHNGCTLASGIRRTA
jgi:hypothetical protein